MTDRDIQTQEPQAEIRPLYVEDWIESLPYADPERVSHEVYEALAVLNRSVVKPSTRFALLELYAHPYQQLLKARSIGRTALNIATFEKNRTAVEGTRKIAVEIAFGYKLVAADLKSKPSLIGSNKHLGRALQRTIVYLSHVLMHTYHEYLPTPKNIWRELHELFAVAHQKQLTGIGVANPELPRDIASTIDHAYRRILLTSLVDPYHLAYGQIWEIYNTVDEWSENLELLSSPPSGPKTGCFTIDPLADSRPTPYSRNPSSPPSENCGFLNLAPLLKMIHSLISKVEEYDKATYSSDSDGENPDSVALMKRMARSWGLPPKRYAPRKSKDGEVPMTSGLGSVHFFLSDRKQHRNEPPPEQEEVILDLPDAITDEGFQLGERNYYLDSWKLVNEGSNGLGLIRTDTPSQMIRVGEIVGFQLQPMGAEPTWTIGSVRWMTIHHNGEYVAGIQIIGDNPVPVTIRTLSSGDRDSGHQDALLLTAPGKPESIIAPAGTFAKGDRILLEDSETTLEL
ncbi:MAG: hypothetical protein GY731_06670, partial [Gammaproteobacteria bacterium]|nr:hypothetical protein [Gammaproteobacteria bacterium]